MNRYICALIAGAVAASALAKPADPRPRKFTQPDGKEITVFLRGDERSHFYLSSDGYLLARDADTFYYGEVNTEGEIVSTGILAAEPEQRSPMQKEYLESIDAAATEQALQNRMARASLRRAAPSRAAGDGVSTRYGLFPGSTFPVVGSPRVVIVLVEYTDVSFKLADPHAYFSNMLSQPGFSDYGGTGSVLDYFTDNSMGVFTPQFDVYGPLKLAHNRQYYGKNDAYGDDMYAHEMVMEAVDLLDDEVDWSIYDTNSDGYVDNIYIYYAGEGEASYGGAATVWPHAWSLSEAGVGVMVRDGVKIDSYGCSNEWENKEPDGIGTFVHEFSHVMGLPDLYATGYGSSFTPDTWSALDYGPYNNDGNTPPNYSIFERNALGWIDPIEIDGPRTLSLQDISTNQGAIIRTPKDNEFFLLENRQKTGWDTYIPGHGMLIWHIDYKESRWAENTVNNNASHQYVDIEEADGKRTETSRAGDAFPGTAGITEFTDDTTPSMITWTGTRLGLPITDITETKGIVSFKVAGGDSGVKDITSAAIGVSADAGVININADAHMPVTVIDATGRVIAHADTGAGGSVSISVNTFGIVLVRVGDYVTKLSVR